jgi:Reverse transcriptase (RNA-dependent DNA polymerase)
MNWLIGPNQLAFLKSRYSLDVVVTVHDVLHHVKIHKELGILLKLDFEKTFDNIEWFYILTTFKNRGFNQLWVFWMHKLLLGWRRHSAIITNGSEGVHFECHKSVRQGDSIFPCIFLLVEGLHKILSLGISEGHFEGLDPILFKQHKIMYLYWWYIIIS